MGRTTMGKLGGTFTDLLLAFGGVIKKDRNAFQPDRSGRHAPARRFLIWVVIGLMPLNK
jgi:hypothetical protein